MRHDACPGYDRPKTTFENLMGELHSIQDDIHVINNMEISEKAKAPVLVELQQQINAVKEKLHDYIDTL